MFYNILYLIAILIINYVLYYTSFNLNKKEKEKESLLKFIKFFIHLFKKFLFILSIFSAFLIKKGKALIL